ncbi:MULTISPECIES: hypothetical protein [Streptomyces]|uniref:Uncharacterized protein n=1 Tax=Streptomyces venezuelae (strain ATCC 10712 / CBS 650.69 / DSM 40230 / JCM 4526 / NBRC 13096 / PD 04745) TaxID=953739 RepID=F2R983_STRVP|nr:hypothetical protein [Streptomyces venezuelae]APE24475.1 hypothetical protein vnz_27885 [Streptomyces venezuelae]QES01839.1 hypothetical protein DEJ43_28335 [Streptomyces venezuelae ATCC 10712]CCA58926.1 hypothetical protein SVEN_5640 [Streptomyces venezuelae ATCC 10712]
MSYSGYEPALRLQGYRPASAAVEREFCDRIAPCETDLNTLAQHHTPDGRQSFFVFHDTSAMYGLPGEPQLLALHLTRDTEARTFTFASARLPLYALAQSWLIQRHCPASAIKRPEDIGTNPADTMTTGLEQRFRDHGNQFSIVMSYTAEGYPTQETVVLLEAADRTGPQPYRILLETTDLRAYTHQLREGAFDTADAALTWLDDRSTPLPRPRATTAPQPPAKPAGPTTARGRKR